MEKQRKYNWLFLVKGIIFVLLSFFVFANPVGALVALAFFIGISLMLTGALITGLAIAAKKTDEDWGWRLAEGIIDLVLAAILLSNPGITASVIPFVVGFWIMVTGVMIFSGSFKAKKGGDSYWWVSLLSGILTTVVGYIIAVNVLVGAIAITVWIGIGLLLFGIFYISLYFRLRKIKNG